MCYLRTKKFNIDEQQREILWKTSWFKALLPGALAWAVASGIGSSHTAADVGAVVDCMLDSVYGMYQFLPEMPGEEVSASIVSRVQRYVSAESARILESCGQPYLSCLRQLVGSEMSKAWGVFYQEYHGDVDPSSWVDIQTLDLDHKDAFISACVLQQLQSVDGPASTYDMYHDILDRIMKTVRDALVRRNRLAAQKGKTPWTQIQFPEPSDVAAVAVRMDAHLLPLFDDKLAEETWLQDMKRPLQKEYLSAVRREVERMDASSVMKTELFGLFVKTGDCVMKS